MTASEKSTEEIFSLIEKYGKSNYIGEPVSIQEHMIQCGMLAEENGYSVEVILGCFFHDIGHLVGLDGKASPMVSNGKCLGTKNHEIVGAQFLRQHGFDSKVSDIVLHHVDAKRFLVYKNPHYFQELSDASKETLFHQGGPMTPEEAKQFEKSDSFHLILQIREWDEKSKNTEKKLKPISFYKKMCEKYLTKNLF